MTAVVKAGGVLDQPFEPGQFIIEFGTRLRVAVRQVQAADDRALAGGNMPRTAKRRSALFWSAEPLGTRAE
jgi:hypothetical protein